MTKLHALLNKDSFEGEYVGIEIEAEGFGMKIVNIPTWRSEDDGSLRGEFPSTRHEFVSRPLAKKNVSEALDNLIASQKDAEFDFSFRTSSHVHVNCLDMDVQAVGAFIYTYFLLEKDLMRYCGEHRNNNRFCLRMVDSDELTDILKTLIRNGFQDMQRIINNDLRYGACNMAALMKYGTLEFRGMRGTLDKEVLLNWVEALLQIRQYAIENQNAWNVYTQAVKYPESFHKSVLKNLTNVFIEPDAKFHLEEALSLTIEIPFEAKEYSEQREKALEKRGKGRVNEVPAVVELGVVDAAPLPIKRPMGRFVPQEQIIVEDGIQNLEF